jgi:hypothetical protein
MANLTHEQAMQRLNDAGISVTSSSGIVSSARTPGTTSLEGVEQNTINGIVNFKEASGLNIVITGGTETGHAQGSQSHSEGYKLDIRVTPGVSEYIQNNFEHVRDRSNGDPVYRDSLGNEFAFERSNNHWDITFRGRNPEPTERESNSKQRDAGVPVEPEPGYDANPPMGVPSDENQPSETNPPDMGTPVDGGQTHDASLPDMDVPKQDQQDSRSQHNDAKTPIDIPNEPNQSVQPPELNQSIAPPEVNQSIQPPELHQSVAPPELNQSVHPPEVNQSIAPSEVNQSFAPPESSYDAGSSDAGGYDAGSSDAGSYDAGSSDAREAPEGGGEAASKRG